MTGNKTVDKAHCFDEFAELGRPAALDVGDNSRPSFMCIKHAHDEGIGRAAAIRLWCRHRPIPLTYARDF